MKLGWYEVILWLVPQPFYCHLCPSFPHLSGLSTQLIKLKDNTETTNMYSVFTGHLAKSASDYFYRNPLLTTKQSYLLMSTHICAEISACTEAKLAGILIQEQQEATEEMLVYWQCHSTEIENTYTSVKLWPTELDSKSTSCEPIYLAHFYTKYSWILIPLQSQFSGPLNSLLGLLFLHIVCGTNSEQAL